jgi:HAD superfamily hydrolase (TIGR01484 family)
MRYLALATDYDGTIAHHGRVDPETLHALERLKESGRKLLLVTGRELPELRRDFDRFDLFDRVIVENGALLYVPATNEERTLAESIDPRLAQTLRERDVKFLSVGQVIVATHQPYENVALAAIRDLGLECQVIFNKGAVMILPSGVNKATGLEAALEDLGLSRHNVVGIGDAENDHAFLDICACAVAVANAVPALRERADLVTETDHGEGVTALIERLLANDLAGLELRPGRDGANLGPMADGSMIRAATLGENILVAGASGGGKSKLLNGLIERIIKRGYQALIIDPEGDHNEMEGVLVLGTPKQPPTIDEIAGALARPARTVVANIIAVPLDQQPRFLDHLLPALRDLRKESGRPHWLVLDEVHHVLPQPATGVDLQFSDLPGIVAATVEPAHVAIQWLRLVDRLIVTGASPDGTFRNYCEAVDEPVPGDLPKDLEKGQALSWRRRSGTVEQFAPIPGTSERRRHVRKYAEGDLGEERSFIFEGPEKKLHLQAKNLERFLELADGVDDDTWEFHRRRHDYSTWVRDKIKDKDLAEEIIQIEDDARQDARASREAVRREISRRYTAAA